MAKRWDHMTAEERDADCGSRARASAIAQGLPPLVEDQAVLAKVARVVLGAHMVELDVAS